MQSINTEYTQKESYIIKSLSWYQDQELTLIIEELLQSSKKNLLLDLCCGPSILLQNYLTLFDSYIGVDKSHYMIQEAKKHAIFLGKEKQINYHNSDIVEFIDNHLYKSSASHILIKNALQFFNFSEILNKIKNRIHKQTTIVIIQTIKEYDDIFHLLPNLVFKERIKKFYEKEELTNIIIQYSKTINIIKDYTQLISISDWLTYHNATNEEIKNTLNKIKTLSKEDKTKYGFVIKDKKVFLKRVLLCSSFTINNI
jgi:tRNA1(Val) A37 N6-methylase TrmN6